jgi:hypothetical protein
VNTLAELDDLLHLLIGPARAPPVAQSRSRNGTIKQRFEASSNGTIKQRFEASSNGTIKQRFEASSYGTRGRCGVARRPAGRN